MAEALDQKLKRFLHYGSEMPYYIAGEQKQITIFDYYETSEFKSIDGLIADGRGADVIAQVIEVYNGGYPVEPEALVLALVICMKQSQSLEVRRAAYKAAESINNSTKYFFAFLKYVADLSKPTTGWGRGLRRVVNNWYLRQEPLKLAENVTRFVGLYGWTHKDALKLGHTASKIPAQKAVLSYVISGLKATKEAFKDQAETHEILEYLQNVDTLKHCKNGVTASLLISANSLALDCVPACVYKSKDVWAVLIPKMSVLDILKALRRLSRYRLLRKKSIIVALVKERLKDTEAIAVANVHPAQILIYLKKYEASAHPRFVDKTILVKEPPPINPDIVEAVNGLLNSSFDLLKPTGLRYIIAVNNSFDMILNKCWQCHHLTCFEATTMITQCILKVEEDAMILVFSAKECEEYRREEAQSFSEAVQIMKSSVTRAVADTAQPVLWALKNQKAADVFIFITTGSNESVTVPLAGALHQYRDAMNLPNTKYIYVALERCTENHIDPSDAGMLEIRGFDEKVPQMIEAFSRGAF